MGKLFETVDFLYDNFEKINTKDEFEGITSKVWKKKTGEKLTSRKIKNICFGLWNKIYDIEISDKKELEKAERLFTKFLKITDYEWFFFEWNDAKYSTLANLILNKKPSKKFNIRNSEDLDTLISSWRSAGVKIEAEKIVQSLTSKIEEEGLSENEKVLKKCSEILGSYSEYSNKFYGFYEHSRNLWVAKLTKAELKERIIEKCNKERATVEGRTQRDHELAILFKNYYKKECIICGSRENIEVSHKIPLHLGPDRYGFDLPFNMELCCHSCHKRYERDFDKRMEKAEDTEKFLKNIHDTDVRNSEWTNYIDSKYYTVVPKPKIDYSGIVKCVNCLRRYKNVDKCKKCNHDVLPLEDAFWKIKL